MQRTKFSKIYSAVCLLFLFAGSVYADDALDKGLKDAIVDGDLAKVEVMVSAGTGNDTGNETNLPKLKSAMEMNIDMFNMSMEDGINVYLDEDPDEIEAWLTSVDKNLSIFRLLVKNIPSAVVRSNQYHFAVFKQAIVEGHLEVIKKLLDIKFDVNMQNGEGRSPLIIAAKEGAYEVAELLIKSGGDVNHKSIYETALMMAVSQGYKKVAKLLLDNNADVNAQVHGGEMAMWPLIRKIDQSLFDLLLDHGADLNIKTRFGNTMLMEAARLENINMVQLLVDKGAKINAVDELGESALMKAAEAGQTPAVSLLLELGADPHKKSKAGETALMKAVGKWRNDKVVKLLLGKGVDITAVSNIGQTASMLASDMGNTGYVEIISGAGAN